MPEEDKSKIDRLKEALYSRKVKITPSFVLDLHGHKVSVPDKWEDPEQKEAPQINEEPKSRDISKKIFIFAAGFFVLSAAVAGIVYWRGSNVISPNNINVDVIGPSSIKAGETTDLDVSITNNNDTTLQLADLLVAYPDGTRDPADQTQSLTNDRISLGDIPPHQTVEKTVSSVLYGEEGKPVHIDMTLEYRLPNSTSVFDKPIAYDGLVGSSPLTVSVDALDEVNANQEYDLTVTVTSNSSDIEKGVLLQGTLPIGFDTVSMSPEPLANATASSTVWNLGDIEPGGSRVITIKGKIYAQDQEQRTFDFVAGVAGASDADSIGADIASVSKVVAIAQPFIGVTLSYDSTDVDSYVAQSGEEVHGTISYVNNLDVPISNVSISAALTGAVIDNSTIATDDGFYDSNTGLITWDKTGVDALATLNPQDHGTVNFTFDLLTPSGNVGSTLVDPTFVTDITVHGQRLLESNVPQDIVSTVHKTVKVATDASLTSRVVYGTGPIENQGTLPPKVGAQTTYTVIWAVTNTFNALSGAQVTATLPPYITWTNVTTPSSENVTYNPDSRQVTWNLGDVAPQANGTPTVRQVAFQIGFTPSVSQVQSAPQLIGVANFIANDTFSGATTTDQNNPETTVLSTDPSFVYGDEMVTN